MKLPNKGPVIQFQNNRISQKKDTATQIQKIYKSKKDTVTQFQQIY
jgi:hypothetical protein